MRKLILVIIGLIGQNANATNTFYCSHSELCKMVNIIVKENQLNDISAINLVNVTGDPHEYEPTSEEIKNLISAPTLITGPNELNPWIKKINYQRSKLKDVVTISLVFDKNILFLYSNASAEEISHFWLYPKVYCALKNKLESELKKVGFNLKNKKDCDFKKIEDQLKQALTRTIHPIILTHNALLPLLLNLDSNKTRPIIAIKGSGHHDEANSQTIKKMYDVLTNKKVVWILETGINLPPNIFNKIRSSDLVIKLDTANTKDEKPFSDLFELTNQLKLIAEKK